MRLVERDKELAILHELLIESILGRGNVALVTGPIGCGKTELLHAFAEQAIGKGAVFLSASGCRAERSVPFGVMNQLCQSAPQGSSLPERMASLVGDMQMTATLGTNAEEVSSAGANVMGGLCSALVELAEQDPVLVGVDDVSDVDTPSLWCLLYLVRRLRSTRALVLLTESDNVQRTRRAFRAELLRLPRRTRLRLALLSPQGVTELLAGQLDGPIPAGFATACHAVSGGNPLLLHALAEDHDNAAKTGAGEFQGDTVVGDAFGQAVLTCLHRCEPATIMAARGLAVLGESASPGLLGQLFAADAAADFAAIIRSLRPLKKAGILDSWRFRHNAARLAVLDDTPPRILSDLHRRAAERHYHKGVPATVVAQHLVAANDPSHRWALPVLQDAAQDALREDRLQFAFRCLELAARACADDAQQAVVSCALARAEWRANPATAAWRLGPLATALRAGSLRGGHVADLITFMLWHGSLDEARDALDRASGHTADSDPETLAELDILRPWLRSSYPTLLPWAHQPGTPVAGRAGMTGRAGRELTSAVARLRLNAATALSTVLTSGADDALVTSVEQLLQGADLNDSTVDAVESALLALIYADRPDRASMWCDSLVEVAAARHAPMWLARLASLGAESALRQGQLPRAARLARMALADIPLRGWGVTVGAPLATLVSAATAMGEHEDAAAQLALPVPAAMFQTRFGLHYLHARGHHYLAANRAQDALCDFLACGEQMRGWGIDQPALVPWRTDAAAAHVSMGNVEEAVRLLEEQLTRLGVPSRTRGISLRLLASVSDRQHRLALLEEAVEALGGSGDRLELARALADLSDARRALGEFSQAQATKHRALQLAKECQATLLCQELPRESAEAARQAAVGESAADGGPGNLSDAERRVAELASWGHTNREIATKLYITVSTVEQHLTRVYRKLDVRNRKDLPASLGLNSRRRTPHRRRTQNGPLVGQARPGERVAAQGTGSTS